MKKNLISTTLRRLAVVLLMLTVTILDANAVLKEKNLEETLAVLRAELTEYKQDLTTRSDQRKKYDKVIINRLVETMKRSNQNALMLYSQNANYVFDLSYACHEATEQYREFQRQKLPFRNFLTKQESEIAKYDSLIASLRKMPTSSLSKRGQANRSACITLATDIKQTLQESREQVTEFIQMYNATEKRLKRLNDYASKRYNDIQTGIFKNGGDNYFELLSNLPMRLSQMRATVADKYRTSSKDSQWNSNLIFGLFVIIAIYVVIAILLNLLVYRFLVPQRFHTPEFLKKRPCIIMATTTLTFAIIMGILRSTIHQNFFIMASDLLIEYAWLLGVILMSLLLRVSGEQIKSAFRIYAPLVFIGFMVIALRIILTPNELVNLVFPPVLLLSTIWQWRVIGHHHRQVPKLDMLYAYISLTVFIASVCLSWGGYTLLAVQVLIWWIMQLTCILTISCISSYVRKYGERHGMDEKPITKKWAYVLLYRAVLPILAVHSIMLSIYWAAGVFNLGDLCWRIFTTNFINLENLKVSIVKLSMVVNAWFIASYVVNTILDLLRMHYQSQDPTTAASREVMGKNVIQVIVWGIWLLFSLSLLHISVAWLLAISGGLSTGIGFASKDIIENIYYGAALMSGRIKVGDWIEIDGTRGQVNSISYTSTTIESLYGEVITFQNSQLFAKNYKNLTRNHGYVLAVIPFGVAYGSNLRQVTQLVEEAVNSLHHEWMDPEKQVKTVVSEMGDSSVNFKLFVWADAVKKSYVVSDVLKCVYETLDKHGINIPFPQRDVHLIKD